MIGDLEAANKLVGELLRQNAALIAALVKAKETIRYWHGSGLSGQEPRIWELYQSSPEMKQINDALTKSRGDKQQC